MTLNSAALPNSQDNPSKQRWETVLMAILQDTAPQTYAEQIRAQAQSGRLVVDHALTFPLSRSLEKRLTSLPHANPQAPDTSRDDRLVAWFEACLDLGADPVRALTSLGEHASGGFARLMKMKALKSLRWWRDQGVEERFEGPLALDKNPTTFPTLALIYGYPDMVDALLPGSRLTHVDRLWHAVWHKRSMGQIEGLIERLWSIGAPPTDALAGLAQAPLNGKNISGVLSIAHKLAEAGCDPNAQRGEQLPPLAQVVRGMTSPVAAQLVRFLLDQGADPLEPVRMQEHGKKTFVEMRVVEVALDCWQRCSRFSHLEETHQECFSLIAKRADPAALRALFPLERQERILQATRAKHAQGSNGWRGGQQQSMERAVAVVEAIWLDLAAQRPVEPTGRRARL